MIFDDIAFDSPYPPWEVLQLGTVNLMGGATVLNSAQKLSFSAASHTTSYC